MMTVFTFLSQETTIDLSDLRYLFLFVLLFSLNRLFLSHFLIYPISKLVQNRYRTQFIHRGFDCIHYVLSTIIGSMALLQRPYGKCAFYVFNCREFNLVSGDTMICSYFEKIYYFYFASYYFSDIFWLHTTKDFLVLLFHHLVSVSMIVICAVVCRPMIGLSIMLLHDWVDAFLYSGKIALYLQARSLSNVLMSIFAVLFFYLRIIQGAFILYILFTDNSPQERFPKLYLFGKVLFCFLYVCHLVWGVQIVNALRGIYKGEKIHDTRSDREPEAFKKTI